MAKSSNDDTDTESETSVNTLQYVIDSLNESANYDTKTGDENPFSLEPIKQNLQSVQQYLSEEKKKSQNDDSILNTKHEILEFNSSSSSTDDQQSTDKSQLTDEESDDKNETPFSITTIEQELKKTQNEVEWLKQNILKKHHQDSKR